MIDIRNTVVREVEINGHDKKVVTVSATLSRRWPEARSEGFLSPQNSVVVS